MEKILHQLINSLSHDLQGFMQVSWCRISSINSMLRYSILFSMNDGQVMGGHATIEPWESWNTKWISGIPDFEISSWFINKSIYMHMILSKRLCYLKSLEVYIWLQSFKTSFLFGQFLGLHCKARCQVMGWAHCRVRVAFSGGKVGIIQVVMALGLSVRGIVLFDLRPLEGVSAGWNRYQKNEKHNQPSLMRNFQRVLDSKSLDFFWTEVWSG